ncbi:MAG: DUF1833 family protein [Chromatiales bacterium]|nr:DUF1833 family protein [Chromatiales bacterium]
MPTDAYLRAVRALAPADRILQCLEIAAGAVTRRLVRGYRHETVGGHVYEPAAFSVNVDVRGESRAPTAEVVIDHTGREIVDWIDSVGSGVDARITIFEATPGASAPDWAMRFRVQGIEVGAVVRVSLGLVPLLGLPSVRLRYDPETAPGLF